MLKVDETQKSEETNMQEFNIHFDEEQLDNLHRRIDCTRLPKMLSDQTWSLGINDDYLMSLLEYWRNGYRWTHKEKELNQYPQFICELNGIIIHFSTFGALAEEPSLCC